MCSTLKTGSKLVFVQSHSEGNHLSDSVDSVMELVAPLVHLLFPTFDVVSWNYLRKIVHCFLGSFSDFPVVSPFGIIDWISRRHRLVLLRKCPYLLLVLPCFLLVLWCCPHQVVVLWLDIFELLPFVIWFGYLVEVFLHQVDILIVVMHINPWILDNTDAKLVETLRDLLAQGLDFRR